jgi:hypothetical protein
MGLVLMDLPHLPLYYCMMISGAFMFQANERPAELRDFRQLAIGYNAYMHEIVAQLYILWMKMSGKYSRFKAIF